MSALQEFGKTKLYLPKQDGLEVLSKEVSSSNPHHTGWCMLRLNLPSTMLVQLRDVGFGGVHLQEQPYQV